MYLSSYVLLIDYIKGLTHFKSKHILFTKCELYIEIPFTASQRYPKSNDETKTFSYIYIF